METDGELAATRLTIAAAIEAVSARPATSISRPVAVAKPAASTEWVTITYAGSSASNEAAAAVIAADEALAGRSRSEIIAQAASALVLAAAGNARRQATVLIGDA